MKMLEKLGQNAARNATVKRTRAKSRTQERDEEDFMGFFSGLAISQSNTRLYTL